MKRTFGNHKIKTFIKANKIIVVSSLYNDNKDYRNKYENNNKAPQSQA